MEFQFAVQIRLYFCHFWSNSNFLKTPITPHVSCHVMVTSWVHNDSIFDASLVAKWLRIWNVCSTICSSKMSVSWLVLVWFWILRNPYGSLWVLPCPRHILVMFKSCHRLPVTHFWCKFFDFFLIFFWFFSIFFDFFRFFEMSVSWLVLVQFWIFLNPYGSLWVLPCPGHVLGTFKSCHRHPATQFWCVFFNFFQKITHFFFFFS